MSKMNKVHGIYTYAYERKTDDGCSIKTEEVTCLKTDPCATLREIQLYAQQHGVSSLLLLIHSMFCLVNAALPFQVRFIIGY